MRQPQHRAALAVLGAALAASARAAPAPWWLRSVVSDLPPPSVALADGPVVGAWVNTSGEPLLAARFLGIPFAAPPVGDLRWAPPAPPAPWSEPLAATAWAPGCAQTRPDAPSPDVPDEQSEDCLKLNVYTPESGLAPGAKLPVLLWLHGGSFVAGSTRGPFSIYEASRVASRGGVVVVAAAYRLDALGWLVTSTAGGAKGNYGLLDQRAALRWVQANAAAFGGDPGQVTLWGESAGAMSALVHAVSPPSAGLFQRVIMESNPAGFNFLTPARMSVFGDELAGKVGCSRLDLLLKGEAQLACLRKVDYPALMVASLAVVHNYFDLAKGAGWDLLEGALQWGPVVDGVEVPAQPMALVEARRLPRLDLLLGHNSGEMSTFLDGSYYAGSFPVTVYNTLLLSIFGLRLGAVKAEYANDGLPPAGSGTPDGGLQSLDKIFNDYWFRCAKEAVAGAGAAAGGRAWSWRFNSTLSFGPQLWPLFDFPQCVDKACHASELFLVFGNGGEWALSEAERRLSDAMIDAWSAFARSGDPSSPRPGAPAWPAYDEKTRLTLVLDTAGYAVQGPAEQEAGPDGKQPPQPYCDFWDAWGYSKEAAGPAHAAALAAAAAQMAALGGRREAGVAVA